jgi:hypothetical protein
MARYVEPTSIERGAERVHEWMHYYKAAPKLYQALALLAVLRNDGEKILGRVLRELQLDKTLDLLKAMDKDWE